MIIDAKKYPDNYTTLFIQAYDFLKANGKISADDNRDQLSTINEYYAYMKDFFDLGAYKFIMLPLEEEPFKIDLNTRQVIIPNSFSRCASIQNDQLAETIIFTVDRYFDYMDLSNTVIYIQWTNPNGLERATLVEMVDLESERENNKIRFAWPLHDGVTSTPGIVKFSVRFVRVDDDNKMLYSLNTLESQIIIKPALQPNLDFQAIESPVSQNLFSQAIVNSQHVIEGIAPPQQPNFGAPGMNLKYGITNSSGEVTFYDLEDFEANVKTINLVDNTLTFYVQAIAPDTGLVQYKWYYQPDKNAEAIELTPDSQDGIYLPVDNQIQVSGERYFENIGTDSIPSYEPYDGTFPATVPLFEKYSAYTIPDNDDTITGYYHAKVWNRIDVPQLPGEKKYIESVNYVSSDLGWLSGPDEIEFTSQLPSGAILEPIDEDSEEKIATLTVALSETDEDTTIQYSWKKATAFNANRELEFTEISGNNSASYAAVEPGWYKVDVTATLNRDDENASSTICKVTNSPIAPVIKSAEGKNSVANIGRNPATLSVVAEIPNGEEGTGDDIAPELLSDELIYQWQINTPDSDNFVDVINGRGITVENNSLTISKDYGTGIFNFKCIVTNKLNEQTASFDHTTDYGEDSTANFMFIVYSPESN